MEGTDSLTDTQIENAMYSLLSDEQIAELPFILEWERSQPDLFATPPNLTSSAYRMILNPRLFCEVFEEVTSHGYLCPAAIGTTHFHNNAPKLFYILYSIFS